MRESPYFKSIPRQLPWVLGFSIVMAVTGPFGSYFAAGLPIRVVYFTATAVLIWLQVLIVAVLASLDLTERWPIMSRMAVAGLLTSVPCTLQIIVLYSWLIRPIPFAAAIEIFPQTAFLTVIISVLFGLFIEQRLHAVADAERARVASVPEVRAQTTAVPDFFRRMAALGRDLLALEMEDHYLRIHTALGSDLILLRLRDRRPNSERRAAGRCIARGGWPKARLRRWSAMAAVLSWRCATGCACRSARAFASRSKRRVGSSDPIRIGILGAGAMATAHAAAYAGIAEATVVGVFSRDPVRARSTDRSARPNPSPTLPP